MADALVDRDVRARGDLTIADRALTAIARHATLQVPGVAPEDTAGAVERTVGRALPRLSWQRTGTHAAVDVEIALTWPASAASVAAAVQEAVAHELERQAGQRVERVSVRVRDVVRTAAARPVARVR